MPMAIKSHHSSSPAAAHHYPGQSTLILSLQLSSRSPQFQLALERFSDHHGLVRGWGEPWVKVVNVGARVIYVVCVAVDKLPKEEDNGEAEMKGWKVKEREGVEWPVWCCTLTSGTDGESQEFLVQFMVPEKGPYQWNDGRVES